MKSEERLKKRSQFRYIYSKAKSQSNERLVMYKQRNGKSVNRIGISVSKKIGKSVVRNKVKRRIKESYRINRHLLKKGFDIIFVARRGIEKSDYNEIQKSVLNLLGRGGLFKEGEK